MVDEKSSLDISENELENALTAQRRIMISDKISADSIDKTAASLIKMDYRSNEPITLLISSKGGNCTAVLHLIDVINSLNSPVDGLVLDDAFSAALDVLQGCRLRKALPHAQFYNHYVAQDLTLCSYQTELAGSAVKLAQDELVQREKHLDRLYSRRVDMTEYRKLCLLGDEYNLRFSAERALEIGLIDEIVTDFKLFARKSVPEEE